MSRTSRRERARKRILILFPKEWDRPEMRRSGGLQDFEFVFAGFDLFRFPSNARLLWFDAGRFLDDLERRFGHDDLDGVVSSNEYFGTLLAAALADRLGLPGTRPAAVVTAQHKYYARRLQARVAPEATPRFSVFPFSARGAEAFGLAFPFFAKPVRATFSVLARRIGTTEDFADLATFGPFEEWIIRRLVKPFNDLMPRYTDYTVDAHHFIAEEPIQGLLANIDGFVFDGEPVFIGVADALMYPGTDAFMRFEYPSRLAPAVQARMRDIARRVLAAMDYRHGFFNVEMFYDPAADSIRILELNPRMASQLAGLYRRVRGIEPHRMLFDLAVGRRPSLAPRPTGCTHAASFVFRRFDGRPIERPPTREKVEAMRARYPDADIMLYLKTGTSLEREMKWMGSYRYALVNVGGTSEADLHARYHAIRAELGFEDTQLTWRNEPPLLPAH